MIQNPLVLADQQVHNIMRTVVEHRMSDADKRRAASLNFENRGRESDSLSAEARGTAPAVTEEQQDQASFDEVEDPEEVADPNEVTDPDEVEDPKEPDRAHLPSAPQPGCYFQ